MPLLGLLEAVLVIGILFFIVYAIVAAVPMPAPWPQIAYGIVALIAVLTIFGWLMGGGLGLPVLHLR